METTIIKKIKLSDIEYFFKTNTNIRFFKTVNVDSFNYLKENIYNFEIRIRHNESTDANTLFVDDFNKMFPNSKVKY